jgi:hypothetical protein
VSQFAGLFKALKNEEETPTVSVLPQPRRAKLIQNR